MKTAENSTKSSKFQPWAILIGVLPGMIIGFKVHRKNMFQIERYLKVVKMNFGSKFGAWVSFQPLSCSPETFQGNLGRTVVGLLLLAPLELLEETPLTKQSSVLTPRFVTSPEVAPLTGKWAFGWFCPPGRAASRRWRWERRRSRPTQGAGSAGSSGSWRRPRPAAGTAPKPWAPEPPSSIFARPRRPLQCEQILYQNDEFMRRKKCIAYRLRRYFCFNITFKKNIKPFQYFFQIEMPCFVGM